MTNAKKSRKMLGVFFAVLCQIVVNCYKCLIMVIVLQSLEFLSLTVKSKEDCLLQLKK